jgi:hypothetical protein
MMIQERVTGREKRSKAGKMRIFTNYLGLNRTAAKNQIKRIDSRSQSKKRVTAKLP